MAVRLFSRSGKINFSEQFFPARPKRLWARARKFVKTPISERQFGDAHARNKNYVKWLERESMLSQAIEALALTTRTLGLSAINRDIQFPRVQQLFDDQGKLLDESYVERTQKVWQDLIWLASALKQARLG